MKSEMVKVYEYHHIAGQDTLLLKVYVSASEALEKVVDSLTPYVATTTMLVFSTPVPRRNVEPPEDRVPQTIKGTAKKSPRLSSRK
jgi:Lrp/AsnC family transcriptional regulator, leucine-responsive regulatory protein